MTSMSAAAEKAKRGGKRTVQEIDTLRKAIKVILEDISRIFILESELREQLYAQKITEEEFLDKRRERAKKLFGQLKQHLDTYKKTAIPNTPFAGAINYALNQWEGLQTYLAPPVDPR